MAEELPDSLHRVISHFSARAASELREPVDPGAIPEVGAFDHQHRNVSLALDSVTLSGLETLEPVRVNWSDGRATLVASTSSASLRGTYRVAETAVSQAALRTAAMLTAGDLAATPAEADTELAAWFRDQELRRSDNGRVLSGMYASHEDTMNTLMVGKSNQSSLLRKALKRIETKRTTEAVRTSTYAHRRAQLFGGGLEAPDVPPIGDNTQYESSTAVYKAMVDAARKEAGPHIDDPANDYARLLNSMLHFNCAVAYVRTQHPGSHTPQEILKLVADTPQDQIPCGAAAIAEGKDPDEVPRWPIDREYFLRADAARNERHLLGSEAPSLTGTFADHAVGLELEMTLLVAGSSVMLENVRPRVTMLRIHLDGADDSELLSRLDAFAGETSFYIDLLRTRIAAALGSDAFLDRLSKTLA